MAKGKDDLRRRRKNKAGQLKAAPAHGKSAEVSRSGNAASGIRGCPAQPVSGDITGFSPFRQAWPERGLPGGSAWALSVPPGELGRTLGRAQVTLPRRAPGEGAAAPSARYRRPSERRGPGGTWAAAGLHHRPFPPSVPQGAAAAATWQRGHPRCPARGRGGG